MNPSDGTQFVGQLAQFSELEQVIQVREDVGAIRQQVAPEQTGDGGTGSTNQSGSSDNRSGPSSTPRQPARVIS